MELLNYKVFGEGQPLIILHGFLGSLDNWLTLGKRFAEDFTVYLVDQRNHGKSFHSEEWGYDEMVEDLEQFISHHNIQNPILLGHSMGGKTVMQYAAYHDQKIEKLIVADIGPFEHPIRFDAIMQGLNAVPIEKLKSREEADEVLRQYVPDIGTRSFLMKNMARTSEGFTWKMNLAVLSTRMSNIGEALNYHLPVDVETLFVRGGNSNYILDEDFGAIREIFPNSRFETVPKAGHWLHAEQPQVFYNKVMSFIK